MISWSESVYKIKIKISNNSTLCFATEVYSGLVKPFHAHYEFICPVVSFVLLWRLLTTDPRNRPVASDAGGEVCQLEDKGSGVGVGVGVSCSDVDTVDVLVHPLTDLRLPGYEHWGVVVNIYQIDLQRACATGCRRAWEQREERGYSIMMGGKDDKRRCVQWKGRLRGTGVEGRQRGGK